MDGRKIFALLAVACVGVVGCHHAPPPGFPEWVASLPGSQNPTDSGDSFEEYAAAADEAERDGGRYLDMVSFYPGQKQAAMVATAPALAMVERASAGTCKFDFRPGGPFSPPRHQRGWRLLGRDLVWKIQDAVQAQKLDDAVSASIVATKFGFDISGGGATDASLGLAIVDEARRAIAPSLNSMDQGQLKALSAGVASALEAKPALSVVVAHEHDNMLEAVQLVQDCYRKESYDDLIRNLGSESRSAIEFLEDLHRKDNTKRPAYFENFAHEADADANWMSEIADLPAAKRIDKPAPRFVGDRPWRKFSKAFFSALTPLLAMNDQTLARTRLLILEASIIEQVKASGAAPKDLSAFPDNLKTDPYSGRPFVYGADGSDYHVYSVGSDLRDDGGETDESYTQPDLKLEKDG